MKATRILRRSVRTYLKMLRSPDFLRDRPHGAYRETLDFYRALRDEFGVGVVKAEVSRQIAAANTEDSGDVNWC